MGGEIKKTGLVCVNNDVTPQLHMRDSVSHLAHMPDKLIANHMRYFKIMCVNHYVIANQGIDPPLRQCRSNFKFNSLRWNRAQAVAFVGVLRLRS